MENRQPQITFNITGGTQNNVGSQISEQHNTFTGNDMKTQSVKASAGNAGNGQNGMSSLLSTPEAQKLWLKAIAAGWVDEDHQPTARLNSKNSQAMFANVMATRLNHTYRRAIDIGVVNAYRWARNAKISLAQVDKSLNYIPHSRIIRLLIQLIKWGIPANCVNLLYLSYRRLLGTK